MGKITAGAFAGLAATTAMTVALRRLHPLLVTSSRYPLPPAELTERAGGRPDNRPRDTLLLHFGFGALAGTLYGGLPSRPNGALYGLGVWAGSYLGWIPAFGLLDPATRHPADRTVLMIAAHLVWGSALSLTHSELERSEEMFRPGPVGDLGRTSEAKTGSRQ